MLKRAANIFLKSSSSVLLSAVLIVAMISLILELLFVVSTYGLLSSVAGIETESTLSSYYACLKNLIFEGPPSAVDDILFFSIIGILVSTFKMLSLKVQLFLIYDSAAQLADRMFKRYVNSSYYTKRITTESNLQNIMGLQINIFVDHFVTKALQATIGILNIAAVGFLLMVNDPTLTVVSICALIIVYAVLAIAVQNNINKQGVIQSQANSEILRTASDAVRLAKTIDFLAKPGDLIRNMHSKQVRLRYSQRSHNFYSNIPKLVIELVIFGVAPMTFLFFYTESENAALYLPIVGTLLIALQRILPHVNSVYSFWSGYQYAIPAIHDFISVDQWTARPISTNPEASISTLNSVHFDSVSWAVGRHKFQIKDLRLKSGDIIAITGPTGIGKTVLLDILAGLGAPTEFAASIDDRRISYYDFSTCLQHHASYLPQTPVVVSGTLRENIEFGQVSVSDKAFERIATDFRLEHLKDDQLTDSRLSGGERQRISLAKTIISDQRVVFLDEWSSALDQETERLIGGLVRRYCSNSIVISVAHRPEAIAMANVEIKLQASGVASVVEKKF